MKIRLLIASPDLDYTEYLSKVLVEKYADVFEVSVCSNEDRLNEMVSGNRADIVLAEAELASSVGLHSVRLPLIFSDERNRGGMSGEGYKGIKKYQRISYLVKEIIGAYAEVSSNSEVYGSLSAQITAFCSKSLTAMLNFCSKASANRTAGQASSTSVSLRIMTT